MDFYMKLPRSKREFVLFMAIISVISVNIIAPLITCYELGFHLRIWADVLSIIPFVWLAVIALVLLTYKPAEYLTKKIVKYGDSFNSVVTINILCTVFFIIHISYNNWHMDRQQASKHGTDYWFFL